MLGEAKVKKPLPDSPAGGDVAKKGLKWKSSSPHLPRTGVVSPGNLAALPRKGELQGQLDAGFSIRIHISDYTSETIWGLNIESPNLRP